MTNRLASATSPYLLQHKDNPVHWWEWSPEAFAEAEATDRPVLLAVALGLGCFGVFCAPMARHLDR